MKWNRWIRLLTIISRIRNIVSYGILKNFLCFIEGKLESYMMKIEPGRKVLNRKIGDIK